MYLTDKDLVQALRHTADHLTICEKTGESGLIFIKENIKRDGFYVDKEDNSVIRSQVYFKAIFDAAGLEIIHESN